MPPPTVFLDLPPSAWVAHNDLAFAVRDAYAVSPGHTLVLPRRLIPTWFDATPEEQRAIFELVDVVKQALDAGDPRPDGYNVGFNAGLAAGQTVMHLHVHVIPRYHGDMDDPRGGVRHVIPSKGNYLRQAAPLAEGGEDPFRRHVLPLLAHTSHVRIVAAFVQDSGLKVIEADLRLAVRRGARVQLVTGDYLHITQVDALETLLGWQAEWSEPEDDAPDEASALLPGVLEVRVVEVGKALGGRAFHPKAWHFEGPTNGVAFVGSSNLSKSALGTGIEWNLRVDRDRDRVAWERVRQAFDTLWAERAKPLTPAWVAAYAQRVKERPLALPPGEAEDEAVEPLRSPHVVQAEALTALAATRAAGRRRALVVLATGLGKTCLAAFDYRQVWETLGREPRLLFVAHRVEILDQAARVFRSLLRGHGSDARVGRVLGSAGQLGAHAVFASVAKLSRADWLARLANEHFDYVVIDEVHHAAADSYRRLLRAIEPGFLLGLTATPDRADAADILGLFDDHLAYRADLARGVAIRRLVPFRYFGLKDEVDYRAENIPWRNGRFDPETLARAVQTERRMETLWTAWLAKQGTKTLVFCCNIAHADYTAAWLRARGVRLNTVHSGPDSDDRELALTRLQCGELDAICAVDVFNEGVDVPGVDRVVMLRPTESSVVFLQQLGRGLRYEAGKPPLTVIDFVGNHRMFLERLRRLVSLGAEDAALVLRRLVAEGGVELPGGCSVEVDIEAKPMLEALFRVGGADAVERAYRELRAARGSRPTLGEMYRMGFQPAGLRKRHGSWFEWVRSEGDLSEAETDAFLGAAAFLDDLEERESMVKSFKMVTLNALLDADALADGMSVRDLAVHSWQILRRSPELLREVPVVKRLPDAPTEADLRAWTSYWRENPIDAWTSTKKKLRTWFRLVDDRLVFELAVDPALASLVRELVDYRMARHRPRNWTTDGFFAEVIGSGGDPILRLPRRDGHPTYPEGETDVRLPDGAVWVFRFGAETCTIGRPAGTDRNALPDLLRGWFGPRAGQPGVTFRVRFSVSPDGLWVEPEAGEVVSLSVRRGVRAYPDLRAAAGHALEGIDTPEGTTVWLPVEDEAADRFAVRVAGSSMDGGRSPLRDGDWALMRLCRGAPASAVEGRVALVQLPGEGEGHRYVIKRLQRADHGWRLVSDHPDGPTLDATDDMLVIAKLDRAIRPEDLAPPLHEPLAVGALADAFGLPELTPVTGRQGGHLFIVLGDQTSLTAFDRLTCALPPRPGETAFVLARDGEHVYPLGVGRWRADEGAWAMPELNFALWKRFGHGRSASRALPAEAEARAARVVEALLSRPEAERVVTQENGRSARILGRAPQGGLRIQADGPPRTVSLVDLGWVAVAAEDAAKHGGLLDEARVNRLRYLDGTPKGSTRWIDTGWALGVWVGGSESGSGG